jgi:hypothetical protein
MSLMFLIYLSAMGVSIALEKQSRRQKAEIALECARHGLTLPPSRPKVQILEALLSIAIGIVMLVPAVLGFWLILYEPFIRADTAPGMVDFYIVFLAGGLTLMFLGGQALRQNIIHFRNVSPRVRADRGTGRAQ